MSQICLATQFLTARADVNQRVRSQIPFALDHEFAPQSLAIMEEAKSKGLKRIRLEQARHWIANKVGGFEHARMFTNLVLTLSRFPIDLALTDTKDHERFQQRHISREEILISYHSVDPHPGTELGIHRRIKESYIPPFYTFDRFGYSGWAEMARSNVGFETSQLLDTVLASSFSQNLREYVTTNGITKYDQPGRTDSSLTFPYVFYAMQIPSDSVMDHARIRPANLLKILSKLAEQTKTVLVVKRHPYCRDQDLAETLQSVSRSPWVIQSTDNVQTLIQLSQSVVVINSGVGMEALIQDKPVYAAGNSDYCWATNQVSTEEGFNEAFLKPRPQLNPDQLNKFLCYYFTSCCVDARSPASFEFHVVNALKDWVTQLTDES